MDAYRHILTGIQKRQYVLIGSGSARRVYDLGNGTVAKVAKNQKGYAQNEKEWEIYKNEKSFMLARVVGLSDDGAVLIMQKADKIYTNKVLQHYLKKLDGDLPYSKEIKRLSDKYELLVGDLERASSWGFINGRLVLIDYGFTQSIRRKYYHRHMFY